MRKKILDEEHENHERWLISYADFITLLFAFFVVMYSVSSVNEGKYRVLSDSLDAAFRSPNRSAQPIQLGQLVRSPNVVAADMEKPAAGIGLSNLPPTRFSEPVSRELNEEAITKGKDLNETKAKRIDKLGKTLTKALSPLIAQGVVDVSRTDDWIEIAINSAILFPSGSALLSRQSIPVLEKIASLLKSFESSIHVEGFTDNVPINSQVYPSNWELSAARAASVVHLFSKSGIEAARLAAVGYGEHHPMANNRTEEGRQKNRRVVLIVNASPSPRFLHLRNRHNSMQKLELGSPKNDGATNRITPVPIEAPNLPIKRGVFPSLPSPLVLPPLPANAQP